MIEKKIKVDDLAKILEIDEKDLQGDIKAYMGTAKKTIDLDEVIRLLVGIQLARIGSDKADIKKVLDENSKSIYFSNPTEVIRLFDDGIIVIKLRFKRFKRESLTLLEKALVSEEIPEKSGKPAQGQEEKTEDL